jgi:hypothetical protein
MSDSLKVSGLTVRLSLTVAPISRAYTGEDYGSFYARLKLLEVIRDIRVIRVIGYDGEYGLVGL